MSVTIEKTNDVPTLKQIATLLEVENKTLHSRNQALVTELASLKGEDAASQLTLEIQALQEKLDLQNRNLFGDSSERRPARTSEDKGETEVKIKTGHGPTKQTSLPVREVVATLPQDERACRSCGKEMLAVAGMTSDTEVVGVVRRKFFVDKVCREIYRCTCSGHMKTAKAQLPMVKGGRYSVEVAAHVAEAKYLDHLPLDRQRRAMGRQGLVVTTTTLWDQVNALAKVLEPCYDALREYIIGADVIGVDETYWKVTDSGPKRWWVWGICTYDAAYYAIHSSRSAKIAAKVLDGFDGVAVCDAYQAYATVAKANPSLTLGLCWAHARRYFVEAEGNYPECGDAIELIGKLFAIDRDTDNPALLEGDAKLVAIEARKKERSERAPPILDELRDWAYAQRGLPKSSLRKAIDYMLRHWQGLGVFVKDPMVPLDNNDSERALRGVVVGRKNHYGSKSVRGTKVAAILYTLCETAKRNNIDPYLWMVDAVKILRDSPGIAPPLPLQTA